MAVQLLPIAFWAAIVLALAGVVIDVRAVRIPASRSLGVAALVLKGVVLLAFLGWWIYFQLLGVRFEGFADLAVLVSIMLLTVPVIAAAIICEVVASRRKRLAA